MAAVRATSPRASSTGFPTSRRISSASSAARASTRAAARCRASARACAGRAVYPGAAAAAAETARSTSMPPPGTNVSMRSAGSAGFSLTMSAGSAAAATAATCSRRRSAPAPPPAPASSPAPTSATSKSEGSSWARMLPGRGAGRGAFDERLPHDHHDEEGDRDHMHERAPEADGVDLEELGVDQVDDGEDAADRPGQAGVADERLRRAPGGRRAQAGVDDEEDEAEHRHRDAEDVRLRARRHLLAVDRAAPRAGQLHGGREVRD